MKPLVTIQRVFQEPAEISVSTACRDYTELRAATDGLRQLEDEKRASFGYEPVEKAPGIALDSRYGGGSRKKLHQAMTSDARWRDLYMAAVRASDGEPAEPYESLAGTIYLPDWNELTAVVRSMCFEGNKVTGEFGTAHSYSTQLKRRGKMQDGLEPVSIYGNVMTCMKNTILGIRSGMSYAGGYMTTPAGSLKVYDNNGSPDADLLRGISDELVEELGLAPSGDVRIEGLTGVFKDPTLRGFVFSVPTNLFMSDIDSGGIEDIWLKSVDRKEHETLLCVAPIVLPQYINKYADRRPEIAPNVDPERPLLPSGVAVLLAQMRRHSREDFDWTLKSLGGMFAAEEGYYVE